MKPSNREGLISAVLREARLLTGNFGERLPVAIETDESTKTVGCSARSSPSRDVIPKSTPVSGAGDYGRNRCELGGET